MCMCVCVCVCVCVCACVCVCMCVLNNNNNRPEVNNTNGGRVRGNIAPPGARGGRERGNIAPAGARGGTRRDAPAGAGLAAFAGGAHAEPWWLAYELGENYSDQSQVRKTFPSYLLKGSYRSSMFQFEIYL